MPELRSAHDTHTHTHTFTNRHTLDIILRLEEAESRHTRAGREQAEVISQLRQEVVEVTETFRAQLQRLQEEQQRVVASLNSELETARDSLTRLQQVCVCVCH